MSGRSDRGAQEYRGGLDAAPANAKWAARTRTALCMLRSSPLEADAWYRPSGDRCRIITAPAVNNGLLADCSRRVAAEQGNAVGLQTEHSSDNKVIAHAVWQVSSRASALSVSELPNWPVLHWVHRKWAQSGSTKPALGMAKAHTTYPAGAGSTAPATRAWGMCAHRCQGAAPSSQAVRASRRKPRT